MRDGPLHIYNQSFHGILQSDWSVCAMYPPHAVVAAGDNEGAVSVEVDSRDWVRVCGECLQALSCPHVPHSNTLIKLGRKAGQ